MGVVLGVAMIGGAESITSSSAQDNAAEPIVDRTSDAAKELRQKESERKAFERIEPQESASVRGEVPDDLLEKIYADLESRTGGRQSDFELRSAEAVRWNDASLGCAEPGSMYQQVLTDGFRVVIKYQQKEYDYRAADRDYFKLCPGLSRPRMLKSLT